MEQAEAVAVAVVEVAQPGFLHHSQGHDPSVGRHVLLLADRDDRGRMPQLLVVARLSQGLSAGGEYSASATFLIESAPPRRRGLLSGYWYVSSSSGKILCLALISAFSLVLGDAAMREFGWRIPFLLGAVFALIGWWIRRHSEETYDAAEQIREGRVRRAGVFEFVRTHPGKALQVFGLAAGPAVCIYVWTAFLPTYAVITAGFDES